MSYKFELFKKLSVKTVCGRPKAPENNITVWLMEVFGVATGIKRGETDKGTWYAFTGSFQASNMSTGKIARAGVLFVPDVVGNLLLPQVSSDDNKAVEFAFRIGVIGDTESVVGYRYVAEPLMPMSENDPIELLSRKMKTLPPASQAEKKEKSAVK